LISAMPFLRDRLILSLSMQVNRLNPRRATKNGSRRLGPIRLRHSCGACGGSL